MDYETIEHVPCHIYRFLYDLHIYSTKKVGRLIIKRSKQIYYTNKSSVHSKSYKQHSCIILKIAQQSTMLCSVGTIL